MKNMQNVYIDKLDNIVTEYNKTYHRTIKMKHSDVKEDTYINCGKKFDDKDPKCKFGSHVRISKHKNIFAKDYAPNWSDKVFLTKKVKCTVPWTYVINDLNDEEIIGSFYEKEMQKPYEPFGGKFNLKVNSSNYITKVDLRNATGTDTSKWALKPNLADLKAEVDKIDVDKL